MLDNLLKEKGYTKYRLSKESGVSTTTILDICNGNVDIRKCAAGTVMRIRRKILNLRTVRNSAPVLQQVTMML